MATILCKTCGAKIDSEEKTCPKCGAVNIMNSTIHENLEQQAIEYDKSMKRMSSGVNLFLLLVSIGLVIVSWIVFTSVQDYSYSPLLMKVDSYVSLIASVFGVILTIIGFIKQEDSTRSVLICIGITVFTLFSNIFVLW